MLKLKESNLKDNILLNNLYEKLSNVNIDTIFCENDSESKITHPGYHFENLDSNLKVRLYNCIDLYKKNLCLHHYFYFFKNYVECEFNDLSNKIGLDFGCWFSLSSSVYSLFKNKKIFAVDFYDKEIIDNLNKQLYNNIEYYNIDNIDNVSKVDWIIIYDVLDSYISDIPIETDFSNRLEYLRNLLNDDGILVLTDFESTTKIKLSNLKNIIEKYFIDYKIYYNNDNGRFVITCYRNVSNANLINIRSLQSWNTTLFQPVECILEKSNIFNKEMNNYSTLLIESEKLSNHYLEKKIYNIQNNVDFEFECKVKFEDNNYSVILQSQDKSGAFKSICIDLNICETGKDGFKIVKGSFNSGIGDAICLLRIIFIYDKEQNYLGNNKRKIELII
tara:strand:+ start:198 stop:1367 length:1170 start_codon:yes stop_codon:yes gene_type:complete